MNLLIHETTHLVISFLTGIFVFKVFSTKEKNRLFSLSISLLTAFAGGILVDLDHFIDYFFAFGLKFRLDYFIKGYQFLKLDKLYIPLHSWELIILLFLLLLIFMNFKNFITLKIIILAFILALFFHLIVDTVTNNVTFQGYSFFYRMRHNFDLKYLVNPKHYQNHLKLKSTTHFD